MCSCMDKSKTSFSSKQMTGRNPTATFPTSSVHALFVQFSDKIGFSKAVIMDRDILFRQIDEELMKGFMETDNKIKKAVAAYSE